MTVKSMPFAITALFAVMASGQTPADQTVEKVFPFTYTDTPQGVQEIVNTMRAITEVTQASVDHTARTLRLNGTANQIAFAGWLFPQLDRLAPPAPEPPQSPSTLEYRLAGSSKAVARVFYLVHTPTPQGMQELVNVVRSITEIQRVTAISALKAVVMRGTAEQIAASDWLINGLDKPAGVPASSPGGNPSVIAYTVSEADIDIRFRTPAVRIFYLSHTTPPQGLQEIVNSLRSLAELQRVVAANGPKAIALKGTDDQVAMAEWLINALDKPTGTASGSQVPAAAQYQLPGTSDVARVFYPHTATPEELQDLLAQVRSMTHMVHGTLCSAPGALALRGTVGQVAMAEKLIRERDHL